MPEEIGADLQSKCPLSRAIPGSYDHNGGTLISKHGDLKVTIPEGAIKGGDLVTISTVPFLLGPFVLPSESLADHICEQNKLQLGQKHIMKSHDSASIALPDTSEGNIHTNKRNAYSEQTCDRLSPGTDKDNEYTRDENAILQPASLDTGEDGGHKNHDTVDVEQLIIFIKNDLPQKRLMLFASKLLYDDVIKDIRRKGKMTVESICKAAFVKEDPEASCMKTFFALEQAGCDNLAKVFHAHFCKPK